MAKGADFVLVDEGYNTPEVLGENVPTTLEETEFETAWLVPIHKKSYSESYSGGDAVGPRYRKVGLNGRPLSDDKPEQEGETDTHREETYVDAFDLGLHHDTSYVYVPLPASELSLEVSASVRETIWSHRSGLRPQEELTSPFGISWSSNLCSYIEIVDTLGEIRTEPLAVTVVDEGGRSQRFGTDGTLETLSDNLTNNDSFFPWPSSHVDKKTYLNILTTIRDGNNAVTKFVFKKKFGNTLTYAPCNAWFKYSTDRIKGSDKVRKHVYWRLEKVEDKYGNIVSYDYGNSSISLIPTTIYAGASLANATTKIQISRSADGRRVQSILDPMNRQTTFNYQQVYTADNGANDDPVGVKYHKLTSVVYPDGTRSLYGYDLTPEPEVDEHDVTDTTVHYHSNINSITDKAGNNYQIFYELDETKSYFTGNEGIVTVGCSKDTFASLPSGVQQDALFQIEEKNKEGDEGDESAYKMQQGIPRFVSKIILPGGLGESLFSKTLNTSTIYGPSFSAASGTKVVDAELNEIYYDFSDIHGYVVNSKTIDEEDATSFSLQWMIYYTEMTVRYGANVETAAAYLGKESFTYDIESGLSLKQMIDFSGNKTMWKFENATDAAYLKPILRQNPVSNTIVFENGFMTKWADPTQKIDALGRTETYEYHPRNRAMTKSVDVHGTVTLTEVPDVINTPEIDKLGRRMGMVVKDVNGKTLREETYMYDDEDGGPTNFKIFMVKKTVKKFDSSLAPSWIINSNAAWENDLVTTYVPDERGRLRMEISDPDGVSITTSYTYNNNNNKISVTDSRLAVTRFYYDAMNRLTETIYPNTSTDPNAPAIASTRTLYDPRGLKSVVVNIENTAIANNPKNTYSWFRYDALGRLVESVKDMDGVGLPTLPVSVSLSPNTHQIIPASALPGAGPLDLVTQQAYNAVGAMISVTDPLGRVTRNFYDPLQRLKHVYTNYTAGDANEDKTSALYGTETGTAVADLPEKTHVEYIYDRLTRNTGASAFTTSGFKPTTIIQHKAVATSFTGTTPVYQNLTSDFYYDAVYRETKKEIEYLPGSKAITQTTYGALYGAPEVRKETLEVTSTDPLDKITISLSDGLGRTVEVINNYTPAGNPLQHSSRSYYTSTGLAWFNIGLLTANDGVGRRSETEFDTAGRAVKQWSSDGESGMINKGSPADPEIGSPCTITEYDLAGNVLKTTNPLGQVWEYTYDARNRKLTEKAPAAPDASQAGSPSVQAISQTFYDGFGNVIKSISPRGTVTESKYDRANRPYEVTTSTLAAYLNDSGNTVTETAITTSVYDKVGNVLQVIDPQGNRTVNFYDPLNRLIHTVTNSLGGYPSGNLEEPLANDVRVTYTYDDNGNKIKVTDGNGATTAFTFDGFARNLQTIWDFGKDRQKTKTSTYNELVLIQRTDEMGRKTNFVYDALHRLEKAVYDPAGGSAEATTSTHVDNRVMAYDLAGNLLSVTYPNQANSPRTVGQTFDKLNRLVTETSNGVATTHSYDKASNRLTTFYGPVGGATTRNLINSYDALNRLTALKEYVGPTLQRTTSYAYDKIGNIVRKTLPNGTAVVRVYDVLNRCTSEQNTHTASSTTFTQLGYEYDKVGNVRRITETYNQPVARRGANVSALSNRTITNGYDKKYRLLTETIATASAPTVTTTYTYDKGDSRSTKVVATSGSATITETYTYGTGSNAADDAGANQLVSLEKTGAATVTYEYDANGNRSKRKQNGVEDVYTYDHENRLASLNYQTGSVVADHGAYTYAYDHRARRVVRDESAVSGRVKTLLVFSGGTSVQEHTGTVGTTPAVEYVRGSDYGGGIGGVLYTIRDSQPSFDVYNARGDVIAQTNSSAQLTYQAQYEAYGKRTVEQGTTQDRQKANTKDEDPTGLLNEGFRYRDLETGSFITRDPMGFVDGPNVYTYVTQNPWSRTDPDGLFWSALVTLASATYDTVQFARGKMSGAEYARSMAVNAAALAADIVTGGMGGGMAIKAAALSCKAKTLIVAGAKAVDKMDNAITAVESGMGAYQAAKEGDIVGAVMETTTGLLAAKATTVKTETPKFCFAAGTLVWQAQGTTAIEKIQVGQRVLTGDGDSAAPTDVDSSWLSVEFAFPDPHGSGRECRSTFLRPATHVAEMGWTVGAVVPMDFGPEIATVDGTARVVSLRACPAPAQGDGRVVTATFQTWNNDLHQLWIEGLADPILVTGGHRFFLAGHEIWQEAHQLQLGDAIRSLNGHDGKVLAVNRLPGLHAVFNFEVEGVHQYHVSKAGLLTHNTDPKCATAKDTAAGAGEAVADAGAVAKGGQPRGADGKWTNGDGTPPGANSEQAVWDAVEAKEGWSVTRGRVHTTDGTGQTRVYDGVAHSPSGKNIGLEVKSGTARKTADQRAYDSRVNSGQSTAVGTGANKGMVIDRVKEIRRPAE